MSSSDAVAFWDSRFDQSDVRATIAPEVPERLRRALVFFGLVKGKSILDIGCGMGENAFALARLGGSVTAIDTSSVAIQKID